jgi:hypothetical protein
VDIDEVDVGAEVQLAPPELAEGEDGEAAGSPAVRGPCLPELTDSHLEGDLDEPVGDRREGGQGLLDRGEPQEVADRHEEDLPPSREA